MESVKQSTVSPSKSKLARTFAKVIHLRKATGVSPIVGFKNVKVLEKGNGDVGVDEELQKRKELEAFLAKQFASISSVKSAYAQLQFAQSPYDVDGIQAADRLLVEEFMKLSELKQCYLKKQFDDLPEVAMVLAEIQEQRSLLKTYEVMGKKLECQVKLKESEVIFFKEKLEEANAQNKLLEKLLFQIGSLSVLDNLRLSGLSSSHFITVLQQAVKSVRSFSRLMFDQLKCSSWELDKIANSIHPGVVYWKPDHMFFAFESLVCTGMFDCFNSPTFGGPKESLPEGRKQKQFFFNRFVELKSTKPKEYLADNPQSTFAKFCRDKYLRVVLPKMEELFFGNFNQRELVNSCQFPQTKFFNVFSEMAKRVWLLHCLAYSFEPEASIFVIQKGDRYSEVYMESIADEPFLSPQNTLESYLGVAFTVVPGFQIGKTLIQSEVYLSWFPLS